MTAPAAAKITTEYTEKNTADPDAEAFEGAAFLKRKYKQMFENACRISKIMLQ